MAPCVRVFVRVCPSGALAFVRVFFFRVVRAVFFVLLWFVLHHALARVSRWQRYAPAAQAVNAAGAGAAGVDAAAAKLQGLGIGQQQ
jgi:hypothetical protein